MITHSGLKHIQQQRKSLPKALGRYLASASRRQGHQACSCFTLAEVRLPKRPFRSWQWWTHSDLKPAISAPLPHFKFPC